MNFLMTTLILVVSTNVFACPQISGTYTCDVDGAQETLVISQFTNSGTEVFDIDGEQFKVDGQTYPYVDGDIVGSSTAICTKTNIIISLAGDIYEDGTKAGHSAVNVSYYFDNGVLVENISGTADYYGHTTTINEKYFCIKN